MMQGYKTVSPPRTAGYWRSFPFHFHYSIFNILLINRSVGSVFNKGVICHCLAPIRVYYTESLQPAGQSLKTVLSVRLFIKLILCPFFGGVVMFTVIILRLFLANHLSESVRIS